MLKLVQNSARNLLPVITRSLIKTNKTNSILCKRTLTTSPNLLEKKEVEVTFVRANGEKIKVKGEVGQHLLDVVINNDIDIDGFGACEGTLTCSTCHLILSQEVFDSLPTKPSVEEKDMLDLAVDITETSRLGCQVYLTEDMESLEVKVPATISDAR